MDCFKHPVRPPGGLSPGRERAPRVGGLPFRDQAVVLARGRRGAALLVGVGQLALLQLRPVAHPLRARQAFQRHVILLRHLLVITAPPHRLGRLLRTSAFCRRLSSSTATASLHYCPGCGLGWHDAHGKPKRHDLRLAGQAIHRDGKTAAHCHLCSYASESECVGCGPTYTSDFHATQMQMGLDPVKTPDRVWLHAPRAAGLDLHPPSKPDIVRGLAAEALVAHLPSCVPFVRDCVLTRGRDDVGGQRSLAVCV